MRLIKIRIAGFKSFVDPATLALRTNLTGILGPNGCGKSNTIDAVRWVMGESSAKHLRGQSMEDVIFNGSSSRKPVGQASVELVFDNSQATLGGEFARFNEISVKRQASRDGKSTYFLNGTRCRRRDITDIFLGTGLGPRSYAIVEQGMISRLIEAKPEELRNTLEEAAGISRYKERRRETETRMRHTRENLERLNDVRDELIKQLTRLEKQAKAAARFRELRQQAQLQNAQCVLLRWVSLEQETAARLQQLSDASHQYQQELSGAQQQQQAVEIAREQLKHYQHDMAAVQAEYYEASAEVAQLEQAIRHQQTLLQRQQDDLKKLQLDIQENREHQAEDQLGLETAQQQVQALTPLCDEQQESLTLVSAQLEEIQEQQLAWQQRWEDMQARIAEPSQRSQVEKSRLEQLERQQQQLQQRLQRLEQERAQLQSTEQLGDVASLERLLEALRTEQALLQDQLEEWQHQLPDVEVQIQHQQDELNQVRQMQQQLAGQLASLETLQQAALHRDNADLQHWLEAKGWQEHAQLATLLAVEAGWEAALETVLQQDLEAMCLPVLQRMSDLGWPEQGVMLYQLQCEDDIQFTHEASAIHLPSLATKLLAPASLQPSLRHIYCADNLAQAFAVRDQLAGHESIVTRDAMWLGRYWLKAPQLSMREGTGVLQRQQQMADLQQQQQVLEVRMTDLEQQLSQAKHSQQQLQQQISQVQSKLNQCHRQETQKSSELSQLQAQLQQQQQQRQRLVQDGEEVRLFQQQLQEEQEQALEERNEALAALEVLLAQRDELESEKHDLQQQWQAKQRLRDESNTQLQQSRLALQSAQQQVEQYQRQLHRIEQRLQQLQQQMSEQQALLQQQGNPDQQLQQALQQAQETRAEVEMRLQQARQATEQGEQQVRHEDECRLRLEQTAEASRNRQDQLKLDWQALQVKEQAVAEQFTELDFEREALLLPLQQQAVPLAQLQQTLEQTQQSIQKLGAINLAAIEEFDEAKQRKDHLDEQFEDLTQALETLDSAISKIDRETRARFKETFERVNSRVGEMFQRLFAGGECYLEMTDNDLLTTGITIMARPPGKRISSIYLMSGGEKALTAVALVFAIFELNPAPFCMLDEVDAPLDEANVGRFCDLVRYMSEHVQFIFITHNRATMELAENLIGVTMREAGVSRLVAVDVAEAVQFANG